ncbi:MAG: hypothetical protein HW374_1351 [Bacteroidetes bacterium]|nr:hypothetical protein [Bacteroidota bacterium]
MDKLKKRRLEAKGWKLGTVDEFLGPVQGKGDQTIIRKGPLKGKKIEWAPTEGVDSMMHVAIVFMKQIFKLEPDGYLITDETRLRDLTDFGSGDVTPILRKIKRIYGIDVSNIANGNLLEIFRRIDLQRPGFSRKEFDELLAQVRHQARRAGLKRSDIIEAIQNVRSTGRIPLQKAVNKVDDAGYLEKRASRGSRCGFERAMKKVRVVKPEHDDEL